VFVIIVAIVLLALIAGGVYLALFDIPAPTTKVEKILPDGRFPK
jgi:hypothetical protein